MNKLTLQRVLPVDDPETVEILVEVAGRHCILFEVSRPSAGRFTVRVGRIPEDVELDLDELLRLLASAPSQFDQADEG